MRARKTDANLMAWAAELRALGYSVLIINGAVDAIVGAHGMNGMFEVKNPAYRSPSVRNRSEVQRKLREGWRGQYATVETAAEAVEVMRKLWEGAPHGTGVVARTGSGRHALVQAEEGRGSGAGLSASATGQGA